MTGLLYFAFLLSGASGLVYQVVWVRMFGNVFGNTVQSASTVVAIFMFGLGAGSYAAGVWADRRYVTRPDALLRAYGLIELTIAGAAVAVAVVLPHLGSLSAFISAYTQNATGWYVLSAASLAMRGLVALVLLAPITVLMGGTLTLLIRHVVRTDLASGGWRIALLYAANTAGAAIGAVLTDFLLVPEVGLLRTQLLAALLNVVAGAGALYLARREAGMARPEPTLKRRKPARVTLQPPPVEPVSTDRMVVLTSVALAMTGFAAMGMEILWFRHVSMLLGGFRAVFSLLLTVILVGIGVGSLVGGAVDRRSRRPVEWFILLQGLFVAATLAGMSMADVRLVNTTPGPAAQLSGTLLGVVQELWFNIRPILTEVAVPALLMGCAFPLANGVVQRTEAEVGRRAGILYFANTAGAVAGSLAAGFVLLPRHGLQTGTTVLLVVAALAVVPLFLAGRSGAVRPVTASLLVSGTALAAWLLLPQNYIVTRALSLQRPGETLLTVSDGLTELIAVTEQSGGGRTLITNGHPMSSTQPLSQRYMRALAHVPLLAHAHPRDVLVIGFGVGNTTHAATLHPTVERVELADISPDILSHAGYFREANHDVLLDPRVAVHINDGRQHLLLRPPDSYDLITLEPPPIAYAGVGALYSREFYALARSRLRAGGYLSQWLPAYQVPPETTLAMVRAFVEVFPQAVLLSGAESDLLLLGSKEGVTTFGLDPDRVAETLARVPAVREDLERIDLAQLHELVGMFVASPQTLARATLGVAPSTDDRPVQEYGVRSMLNFGRGVPSAIVDLTDVSAWCPRCYVDGAPVAAARGLDTYLALLDLAYRGSSADTARARQLAEREGRRIAGSRYLGMIVPETSTTHSLLGIGFASAGQIEPAITEFRRAVRLDESDASAQWHLGAALFQQGEALVALSHLQRSVALDPNNSNVHNDLGLVLGTLGRLRDAVESFERAVALDPGSVEARNNLALARRGGS